ncbi:hypothetical protein HUF15_40690 [Streptomyces samsunensis]|uniref:Uncharacterized protein n=2 Tax=Streptomyces malaysiensis TaxID=92644 RepID=A0A2J7Z7B1_STRMQ|nr:MULTISPECIES: hypothetical protein [Streptomyces]MCC4316540.1 hypothetical protein [Streptomyces malaysiensis]MCD9592634.1 hypothetical protein [Streptomyces sp. 8ZJF_21]MCM3812303.1 hypothetical protein [Streptomyces sp. DR7-3]MCQ6246944.1 hypothetical protein [Streptomyces malaysiensis]NUH42937.1 hypothetical protein [Streptomyces samsunensis]
MTQATAQFEKWVSVSHPAPQSTVRLAPSRYRDERMHTAPDPEFPAETRALGGTDETLLVPR